MKINSFHRSTQSSGIVIIALLTVLSCKRFPEPNFSYTPTDNPEAGENIQFTNESVEANTYEWEFGDGGTSSQENPEYIYEEAGIFNVKLTAFNDAGDEAKTEAITINEPTILGFFITDSTGEIALSEAEVWVYDNEFDFENFNDPQFSEFTDTEGFAEFINMESMNYYVLIIRLEEEGFWGASGSTGVLTQNEVNGFNVKCAWSIYTQKKSASSIREELNRIPFQLIGAGH